MSTNKPTAHDLHVKERLPAWVNDLKPQQLAQLKHLDESRYPQTDTIPPELNEALSQVLQRFRRTTFALARAMADMRSVANFAEPLLMARMHERLGLKGGQLREMKLVRCSRDWSWSSLSYELGHVVEPLLQAALQNFEKDAELQPETVAINGELQVNKYNNFTRFRFNALPFSATRFAEQCHDLDLGLRYQTHLNKVLGREEVRTLAIRARREQLQLDLLGARLRGLGGDPEQVQKVIDGDTSDARPRCERFSLFGVDILDTVLIRPAHSDEVFLYLPGMPLALTHYPDLAACELALVAQLCQPALRQRFFGFIQQDRLEHFASVLQRNLTGQTLPADRDKAWTAPPDSNLHWAGASIDDELFAYLQDRHHRRLLNEARHLAVPSADVDEAARQSRLRYWESIGLDLLGVAAFFIPAAGTLMMVVFAAQLLDEVYEGVEAWEQGDIDGALEHAKAVAIDIGTAAATSVATHFAGKLARRMVEVIRPDGTPRLWNGDLAPYRVGRPATAELNELGLLESGDQHYLQLDDGHYRVERHPDSQRWCIQHPDNPRAARPVLEHNAEGAWHGAHERPLEWTRETLLRRLGTQVADYSDEELEVASRVSGTRRDELLDVYLKHAPMPRRLLATLQRIRAGEPAQDPLEGVFEALYRASPVSETSTAASERLALLSLPRQAGWPADCALELRLGDRSGPLRERAGERFAGDSRLIVKVPGGYRAVLDEQPRPVVEDLFDAIRQSVPELGTDSRALKNAIVEQAQQAPDHTRSWVWAAHSDGWRDDGRLLGGFDTPPPPAHYPPFRAPVDPLRARYRRLYPSATDEQVNGAFEAWEQTGLAPHLELRTLERQLEYLRTSLGQWGARSPKRLIARDRLISSWQRNLVDPAELDLSSIGLDDEDFASLPHLADAFGHVDELNLSSNTLRNIPHSLVRQLSPLRTLWASALDLTHLPAGLGPQLEVLELTDNNITWSPTSQDALAEYPALQHLNLSGNPLNSPPYLGAAPNLREVSLFDCSLREVPRNLGELPQVEHLDLSSNMIISLPSGLEQEMSASARRGLSLEHNPLDEDAMSRIDTHYQTTGIDMMVAEDDFTTLLLGADDATRACWDRLTRLIPVEYRRDLRGVADEPMYHASPLTTRRRFWFMLRWLETSPRARASAQRIDASKLLQFEMLADLELPEPFATPRLKTEHYLRVAVSGARCLALDEALLTRVPEASATQREALRSLALQRLANDPQLRMRIAPTASEPLNLLDIEDQARHLDGQWMGNMRNRLRMIDGNTAVGRDALLAEQANGEPVLPFWIRHLEQRYHAQFEQLQEQATAQLLDAEHSLTEGEYLNEANHLRMQLDRERQRLLDDLTRSIAEGTQTHW